jgi:hypothetical protein
MVQQLQVFPRIRPTPRDRHENESPLIFRCDEEKLDMPNRIPSRVAECFCGVRLLKLGLGNVEIVPCIGKYM